MQESDFIALTERVGSLGLLGWLVVWATTRAWPKVSAHLDAVGVKLDRIGAELTEVRRQLAGLEQRLGAGSAK